MANKHASIHDQTNILPPAQLIPVFLAMSVSLCICAIDQTALSVALPTIGKDLNATHTVSWAATAALISNTVFQVLYGRLSDIFGRKEVFLSAMVLLAVADLACAVVRTGPQLYGLRAVAGVANGGITALVMMIVSDVVTLEQRGKYQGILGATFGLGNAAGPFLSAAFIERHSWRGIFWLMSPCALIAAAVVYWVLPPTDRALRNEDLKIKFCLIDYWGVFCSATAIIVVLVPVSGGGSYFEWNSPLAISMLTVGGFFGIVFVLVEWRLARLPMMPLRLFRIPAVGAILMQNVLYGVVYYTNIFYLPMYFELVRGWNTWVSASLTVPFLAGQSLFSVLSGQYISRTKRYGEIIWAGFFVWTLGVGLKCIFSRYIPRGAIVAILLVEGAGAGFVFQPTLVAAQAHSTKADRAVVISVRNFLRCLGGACGLALSAAVLSNVLQSHIPPGISKDIKFSTFSVPDLSGLSLAERESVMDAYMAASRAVFILCAPFIGICLVLCILIKDKGLQRKEEIEQSSVIGRVSDDEPRPVEQEKEPR